MTSRPLLLNTEMVRAVQDGRKTIMRRPLKPQPGFETRKRWRPNKWFLWRDRRGRQIQAIIGDPDKSENAKRAMGFYGGDSVEEHSPFGVPGDRLYVRETWTNAWCYRHDADVETASCNCANIIYRADRTDVPKDMQPKWKASIHMPRWASRVTLEVMRVWVERVQEISDEDAKAEGLVQFSDQESHDQKWGMDYLSALRRGWASPIKSFAVSGTPFTPSAASGGRTILLSGAANSGGSTDADIRRNGTDILRL